MVGLLPGDRVPAIPTANLVLGLLGLTSTGGLVMIFFAVGIARSWDLLGLRGGGLLDFLAARAHGPREPKMPERPAGP